MPRLFALVPAAGSGARIGEDLPKQYRRVAGRPLLYHALRSLAGDRRLSGLIVVLARGDTRFRSEDWSDLGRDVDALYCGGETRAASVYNGLVAARDAIHADDWVLVHDAARPCLSGTALDRLVSTVGEDPVGGLLAVPVTDTLKRAGADERAVYTEPRAGLWQAQTPQMFRYGLLLEALRRAGTAEVTDEAGAMERIGLKPKLVRGEARNLKVTYPEDVELAERILERAVREQERGAA